MYPRPTKLQILEALKDTPVVSVLGPRQVGKSTLVKVSAPDRYYLTLDDEILMKNALQDGPGFIQSLPEFVIIDEVQRAPNLMMAIKKSVDENRKPGRFLLTGSANLLLMEQLADSLAGRNEIIHLHPLTSHEINSVNVNNSFAYRLINRQIESKINAYPNTFETLKDKVCRGGYPEPLKRTTKRAKIWFNNYIKNVINRDVKAVEDIKNPDALLSLLKLCAARTGTLLEVGTWAKEVKLSTETLKNYLSVLEKLFLINRLPAWSGNLSKRLIKSPKIHLIDSGMACALCGITPNDWLSKADLFGHVLESYAVQQISAQIAWLEEEVECLHYRDQKKREVDLVLSCNGKYWGIEMKRSTVINDNDYRGMRAFADAAGDQWQGGIIFYSGDHIVSTPVKNTFAMPYAALWGGLC